ncbi:hypothetical protein PCANC_04153 [Puccinia coronata f. sp. avenae]|uniref:Uncharacterized protein n=1 Tax=Puccinia coronata f. sp. avenae TaxID=200324 RepID=A0A2N5W764_9BASI|nr:hypothetical protein PCANC_04153 [Puccinia coronata f. sp. avenae]
MIFVILILALARQNLGAGSEQELVQIAGVTPYAQPAGASNGPLSHLHASAVTEPHAVKLDAEALARSLPSDNPESSRCHEVVITIDPDTPRGSNSKEAGLTLTSFTDLREPESSHTAGINQMQAEEDNHSVNPDPKNKQSTSSSSGKSTSDSKITGFHRRMNNPIGGKLDK